MQRTKQGVPRRRERALRPRASPDARPARDASLLARVDFGRTAANLRRGASHASLLCRPSALTPFGLVSTLDCLLTGLRTAHAGGGAPIGAGTAAADRCPC